MDDELDDELDEATEKPAKSSAEPTDAAISVTETEVSDRSQPAGFTAGCTT